MGHTAVKWPSDVCVSENAERRRQKEEALHKSRPGMDKQFNREFVGEKENKDRLSSLGSEKFIAHYLRADDSMAPGTVLA